MKKNLIICTTPLHVVIAERIIDLHPNEEFLGIVYSPDNIISDKYAHYVKRLEAKCGHRVKVIYPKYGNGTLRALLGILSDVFYGYRLPKFDVVIKADYLAEDAVYTMIRQQAAELKSFDDGLMNIALCTYAKQKQVEKGRLYKIVTRILGIEIKEGQIISRLTEHFTIYKQKNVIHAPKMTYIDLFPSQVERISEIRDLEEEPISIFLGQPIYELEYGREYRNVEVTQYLIDKYHIQYYYPHPREKYQIAGVQYINSPLIIEDYLLQELARNKGKSYNVYTYCSSALVNLQGLPDYIKFTALYPSDCPERLKETYDLLRTCNIQVVDVDTAVI